MNSLENCTSRLKDENYAMYTIHAKTFFSFHFTNYKPETIFKFQVRSAEEEVSGVPDPINFLSVVQGTVAMHFCFCLKVSYIIFIILMCT